MKKMLFSLLLINALSVIAQNMQINMTQEQVDKLDIKLGALNPSHFIPLLSAPAKVVVPANRELIISSTQPGLVMQLLANIGDSIEKGQILAKLNSPELLALQRDFLTEANEMSLSELEYGRDKTLLDEGVIADRRWQETQAIHNSKSTRYDTARQLLILAGMSANEIKNLAQTRQLSSQLNISSPIRGIVLERSATVGARLDIQAPLYRIADLSELWLEINIPQERLSAIHIGDLVKVENTTVTAKISLLGQSVNRENQTVSARAVIDGKQNVLRVGQNVNVQILQNSEQDTFKIANSAIAQNDGRHYIFVRNAEGFRVAEIKIVGKQDGESLISIPLAGNEQIALKGTVALKADWLGLGGNP